MGEAGARVDEHHVVCVAQRLDDLPELRGVGLGEGLQALFAGDDREPALGVGQALADGGVAGENLVEADLVVDPEHLAEVRHPEVRVDDHHVVSALLEDGADVDGSGGLADATLAARDRTDVAGHGF